MGTSQGQDPPRRRLETILHSATVRAWDVPTHHMVGDFGTMAQRRMSDATDDLHVFEWPVRHPSHNAAFLFLPSTPSPTSSTPSQGVQSTTPSTPARPARSRCAHSSRRCGPEPHSSTGGEATPRHFPGPGRQQSHASRSRATGRQAVLPHSGSVRRSWALRHAASLRQIARHICRRRPLPVSWSALGPNSLATHARGHTSQILAQRRPGRAPGRDLCGRLRQDWGCTKRATSHRTCPSQSTTGTTTDGGMLYGSLLQPRHHAMLRTGQHHVPQSLHRSPGILRPAHGTLHLGRTPAAKLAGIRRQHGRRGSPQEGLWQGRLRQRHVGGLLGYCSTPWLETTTSTTPSASTVWGQRAPGGRRSAQASALERLSRNVCMHGET